MSMVECKEGRWVKHLDYDKLKRAYQALENAVTWKRTLDQVQSYDDEVYRIAFGAVVEHQMNALAEFRASLEDGE